MAANIVIDPVDVAIAQLQAIGSAQASTVLFKDALLNAIKRVEGLSKQLTQAQIQEVRQLAILKNTAEKHWGQVLHFTRHILLRHG